MKCPYQTVTITQTIKGMAIGSGDCIRTEVGFKECLHEECPAYYEVFVDDEYGFEKEAVCRCKRVNQEQGKKK